MSINILVDKPVHDTWPVLYFSQYNKFFHNSRITYNFKEKKVLIQLEKFKYPDFRDLQGK